MIDSLIGLLKKNSL